MTLRHYSIFISVVENKTMKAAAEKLFITQPTISQAVKELEQHYNTILFDRLSKKLFLTEAGRQLYFYSKQVVSMSKETEERMFNSSMRNKLRIGATMTAGSSILIDILRKLSSKCPRVEPEVFVFNTSIIEEKLLCSEIDVALIDSALVNPHIICQSVMEDRLVLVCKKGHRLSSQASIKIEDLNNESLILRENGSATRKQFEANMVSCSVPYVLSWTSNTILGILKAVSAGYGVTVISEKLIDAEWKEKLSVIRLEGDNWSRDFSIIYHKNKQITNYMATFMHICGYDITPSPASAPF